MTGLIEEKHERLKALGVFDEYRSIHQAYAALVEDPHDGLEATKRALFLQWYAASGPVCFTGIWELDHGAPLRVLQHVERLVITSTIDDELQWMLAWYYHISDCYFEGFSGFSKLKAYLKRNRAEIRGKKLPYLPETAILHDRGQMSDYWCSVLQV